MADEKNNKKKLLIIILCSALAVLIAAGGVTWALLGGNEKSNAVKKKPSFNILTEDQIIEDEEIPDDIIADIDIEPDIDNSFNDHPSDVKEIGFVDQKSFATYKTDYLLTVANGSSVNNSFIGFGATYYPWIYWNDGAGRNYTEKQRQIELDRLTESGTTWIRSVIYARPEWYNSSTDEWEYEGDYYDGLVKFFKEVDKRGVEVMLNFEWGGSIQQIPVDVFSNNQLKAYPVAKKTKMYGDFCASFTKALKAEGINCVKYITFFSEPSNRKELGVYYDDEEFQTVHVAKIVPAFTSLVKSAHDAFAAANIRSDYKFIGGNQASAYHSNARTWEQFKPLYDATKQYFDEYSYHFYNYLSNPKGYTYDGFAGITEKFVADLEENLGIKSNNCWFDEINVSFDGKEEDGGPFYNLKKKYGTGIYALKDEPYTGTQLGNTLLALLNGGYKTAALWTFTNNLWPDNTTTGSSFSNGTFLCGMMPNLMDSQVPYYTYYTYSLISRYCKNASKVCSGDNIDADGMATSCVYDKDGNVTVYVINSNLYDVEYKVKFDKALKSSVFYRHLYNPKTFVANTAAKPIGVDRVLVNVTEGFIDTIPAGGVAVYTTSKY
ncbi:MAG: hypothetical protein J5662_00005 [Clostridia bacterium]|nr:hypothetical protein [Clostridia bacterium]